jgi:hypothetical protein
MQTPLEIAFQNSEPSDAVRSEIERQAKRLERFSDRITSCHVTVVAPQTRHRHAKWRKVSWRRGVKGPLSARFAAARIRVADGPPQRILDKGCQARRRG